MLSTSSNGINNMQMCWFQKIPSATPQFHCKLATRHTSVYNQNQTAYGEWRSAGRDNGIMNGIPYIGYITSSAFPHFYTAVKAVCKIRNHARTLQLRQAVSSYPMVGHKVKYQLDHADVILSVELTWVHPHLPPPRKLRLGLETGCRLTVDAQSIVLGSLV